jgi:hypothetical protein
MMFQKKFAHELIALLMLLGFSLSPSIATAQKKDKTRKKEERAATAQGTPVLWREPTDIASLDLFLGPGGEEMKPDVSSVTFVSDETGGYSVKFRVRDGAGKTWTAKLGKEAQPETASLRLVWAAGYMTEVNYLVPCVHIQGAPKPRKSVERCEGDGFANVRFKSRPKDEKNLGNWDWNKNPFTSTKEFKGLIIIMGLLNNWDLKQENNKILFAAGADGQNELRYAVTDLGATFGKTGNAITHNRNEPETYVKTKFVKKVEGDKVLFDYHGKDSGLFHNITVEEAKWIGDLLSRLSDQQISDAFRAANYSPEEIKNLTEAVRARINELVNLSAPQTANSN